VNADEIQLPHLETFARAAELASFTAAARALGLTQAAVSQRMQVLERILKKSLFERRGGRVMLTDAGRKLYGHTQQILNLHRTARRELTGHEPPVRGELLLAGSSIPGEHLLPGLLAAFSSKYPHIKVRAAISDSREVMKQVERGETSVGLVGRKSTNPHLDFRRLASDRMVLIVPPGHVLSKRKSMTSRQLAAHPLVVREAGSGLRDCFEKALEAVGRSLAELRVVLELGSNEAIKAAVQRGVGVAVLSILAVQKEVQAGQLHALELADLHGERDLYVVQDRRRVPSLAARLFLTFLETTPLIERNP
jgi:DNA-binding transcriptional LysR family regulator